MSDWNRVQELFLVAVELPGGERSQLLDSLCAHDPELRAEVESLLASDRDSATVIVQAIHGEAALLFDSTLLAGKRLGAYRIVREIGRGGMGAVYLAVRDDEEYQKQVAIKVVKPGMDTVEVLDRFRYERQILANLDHPNIARLFDGGSTSDGLPFFVMEYVEGQPVNTFCRESRLNNRARCELFLRILEPVSYAHRNLVVHRDLKPGNIFVTAEGTPKLLDFGIAKLLSGNPDGSQTATTVLRPFTPEYASPEQVRGLSVTTSTDIYSLGAVLYELLTERRAQPITTSTPEELERTVCQSEPTRPSQVAPSVDADLDNIVLMAMRKEPERRYHSVDQFAEDIQRHLEGRPVLARQNSVAYRVRKFVLRNRVEIGMVMLVVASLTVGLVISIAQARRARVAMRVAESQRAIAVHESTRAETEARRTEEALASEAQQREAAEQERDIAQEQKAIAEQRVAELFDLADSTLFDAHDAISKLPGSMAARKSIVDTTLKYLEHLREQTGLSDQMRIALAAAYYKVSLIQGSTSGPSMQDFAAAEASLQKGKSIILPLYQKKSSDSAVLMRWIEIQSGLADLAYQAGRQQEAISIETELLPVTHKRAQIKPCSPACELQEPVIENDLGKKYLGMSDPRGLDHAMRGVAIMRVLVSRYPDNVAVKQAFGSLLAAAAGALRDSGELDRATEYYRQSIQIREQLLHDQPQDNGTMHNLMVAYGNYAIVLGVPGYPNLNKPAEARVYAAKSLALAREAANSDPQDATARMGEGMALARLGMIDPPPDGVKDSLATLQKSYEIAEPIAKANPKSAAYANQLATILDFQGHRFETLGQRDDAIQSYRNSVEILRPFLDSGNKAVVGQAITSENDLARVLAATGGHPAALEVSSRAVAQAELRNASAPPNEYYAGSLAHSYATQAIVQEKAGNFDLARQDAEKALVIFRPIRNRGVISIYGGEMANTETQLRRLAGVPPP